MLFMFSKGDRMHYLHAFPGYYVFGGGFCVILMIRNWSRDYAFHKFWRNIIPTRKTGRTAICKVSEMAKKGWPNCTTQLGYINAHHELF